MAFLLISPMFISCVEFMKQKKQFLLVEPVAKTPYPPLGLMKISSMLKDKHTDCSVFSQVGNAIPQGLSNPEQIYITTLFTWDLHKVISSIDFYKRQFPDADINVGGIAASLLPEEIKDATGIEPHQGLLEPAESYPPDYSLTFDRKNKTSISYTTRGCIRKCQFCNVNKLEPQFLVKNDWERDIDLSLPQITFWDNNWLASPNFELDALKISELNKKVDFNQGLDARLYTGSVAKLLSKINIDPIRFAFDDICYEKSVLNAIKIAKKHSSREISVYVLYNFNDTPEEFYYKIDLLNRNKVLVFPMGYRGPISLKRVLPGKHWNSYLLRALKLTLLFYYRRGMITESRESFLSIYGNNAEEFKAKLYSVYEYDKNLKRKPAIEEGSDA